jgi:hypothetical protein
MPVKSTRSKKTSSYEDELEDDETIWLKDFEFNMKKVPCPTIVLMGKRFSGKSYTAVSICEKLDMYRWAAWCGTKDTEDFWAERFESNATVKASNDAGKQYLIQLIKYQQRKAQQYKRMKREWPKKLSVGLIFDDITANKNLKTELEDLFSNGRHYHCAIIVSAQYPKQLIPAIRLNTDYMFMMHNSKRTIKILYDEYVEEPEEFGMFLELIRCVTGQKDEHGNDLFNALVYDNVNKSQRIDDVFKIYRNEGEDYINKVKLGKPDWREYNKLHFKDEETEQQVKEERKRERERRLKLHREKQLERRNALFDGTVFNPAPDTSLDIYDDTDSEKEDEQEQHDTATLQPRRGQSIRVQFSKQRMEKSPSEYQQVQQQQPEPDPYQQYQQQYPIYSNDDNPHYDNPHYEYQQQQPQFDSYHQQQDFIRTNSRYVPNPMFL